MVDIGSLVIYVLIQPQIAGTTMITVTSYMYDNLMECKSRLYNSLSILNLILQN